MTTEQLAIDSVLSSWRMVVGRTGKIFSGLTEEQLFRDIAPGKNRPIYIWGHLTAVHDALLTILGLGERLHPELDAMFVKAADKEVREVLSGAVVGAYWEEINARLFGEFKRLTSAEWMTRHMSMTDDDFAKDPLRNRLSVLLSRMNHTSFHIGQIVLTK